MSKRTYRVEHEGQTFTRTTARTYTHLVLAPQSLAENQARAEESARWNWKHNQAYHQAYVDGSSEFLVKPSYRSDEEHAARTAENIASSTEWLAKGLEGHIADARAAAEAYWRKGYGDRATGWAVSGWAGRADLAAKVAKPGDRILEAREA